MFVSKFGCSYNSAGAVHAFFSSNVLLVSQSLHASVLILMVQFVYVFRKPNLNCQAFVSDTMTFLPFTVPSPPAGNALEPRQRRIGILRKVKTKAEKRPALPSFVSPRIAMMPFAAGPGGLHVKTKAGKDQKCLRIAWQGHFKRLMY
jgi:hypothetical protein